MLTLVCIFSLSACNLLETFLSFERVEVTIELTPSGTIPEGEDPEKGKPDATKPEDIGSLETTPESTTPELTPPDVTTPQDPPTGEIITVSVVFQSGGIHRIEDQITTSSPALFSHILSLFASKYDDIKYYHLTCYLNDVQIDPNEAIFVKDGDRIYLEEASFLPGQDVSCTHIWEFGVCSKCNMPCNHEAWDDNRACLVCGAQLGVDFLYIQIYENGEYRYESQNIEIMLSDLLMAYYPYPWDYMTAAYEFYFNGLLITDGAYMIVESGVLELVTRN